MTVTAARPSVTTCGARARSTGAPRGRPVGWGTSHVGYGCCKLHGGATPSGTKAAAKQMIAAQAREVVLANPAPPPGAPQGDVLRWLAALVAGQLEVTREQVAALTPETFFDKRGRPNP